MPPRRQKTRNSNAIILCEYSELEDNYKFNTYIRVEFPMICHAKTCHSRAGGGLAKMPAFAGMTLNTPPQATGY